METKRLTKPQNFSLEEIISFMPGHVYWLNKDNIYLGCNPLQATANGMKSPNEIIGKRNADLPCFKNHQDIVVVLDQNNINIMQSGVPQTLEELTVVDGVEKIVLTQKVPLKNANNEVVGLLGISFDITERKQAEKELQESKKTLEIALENIVANMPGHIYWKNKKGVFLGANDKQAKTVGFPSGKELIGKTTYDTLPKEEADIITKNDIEIMNSGIPNTVEELSTSSDGTLATYLSKKGPLYNSAGEVVGILGISLDISELKKTQQALAEQILKTARANQSKMEFLSIASHEVRGPVSNAINLLYASQEHLDEIKDMFHGEIADILSAAGQSSLINQFNHIYHKISECHTSAHQEAYRALNSLISIGELFALQREGIKVKMQETDLKAMINSIVEKVAKFNRHGIQFRVEIPKDFPVVVLDQRNVQQALAIFVNNAMRFSNEKGLVKIKVEQVRLNKKNMLQISVQDNGIGIAESQIESLFSMAIVEDEDKSHAYRKPSLQLPQAKMKIEAAGGSVSIESTLNKGTTVIVRVPVDGGIKELTKSNLTSNLATQQIPRQKLLLVEDDLLTQKIYQQLFQEFGQDVDVASTGSEAIKLGLNKDYDIIFLDITLPDMSGIDVVRQIRKHKGAHVTFVAITSHASDDDIDYFTNDKIDIMTVLTKPVSKHDLKACLEDVIAAKADDDEDENL